MTGLSGSSSPNGLVTFDPKRQKDPSAPEAAGRWRAGTQGRPWELQRPPRPQTCRCVPTCHHPPRRGAGVSLPTRAGGRRESPGVVDAVDALSLTSLPPESCSTSALGLTGRPRPSSRHLRPLAPEPIEHTAPPSPPSAQRPVLSPGTPPTFQSRAPVPIGQLTPRPAPTAPSMDQQGGRVHPGGQGGGNSCRGSRPLWTGTVLPAHSLTRLGCTATW